MLLLLRVNDYHGDCCRVCCQLQVNAQQQRTVPYSPLRDGQDLSGRTKAKCPYQWPLFPVKLVTGLITAIITLLQPW